MEKRTYAASDQTKHALAAALKELMAQKPIDKITIHDITGRCGIRRQNFYYHFEDVYDLMRWMFQDEAVSLLRQHEGTLLWQEGLLQLFRYIEENKAVCLCALRSVGREHLKRFLRRISTPSFTARWSSSAMRWAPSVPASQRRISS